MNGAERLLHKAHKNFQRAACGGRDVDIVDAKVRSGNHREPPKLNMSQFMKDHYVLNYYKLFCQHDKLLLERCTKCKRKGIVG